MHMSDSPELSQLITGVVEVDLGHVSVRASQGTLNKLRATALACAV